MKKLFEFALGYLILLSSCEGFITTSSKWSNNSPIVDSIYRKDSIRIIKMLKDDLMVRRGFFSNREYSDSTKIIVDTIIYDSTYTKFAVFIITKNPTRRQLFPDKRSVWYYNANCYLGIRKSKDSILLSSTGPVLINSIDQKELRLLMRDEYFTIFGKIKNEKGELKYKYNLGDIRFWESPIWDELEMQRIRKDKFEKEESK